MDPFPGPIPFVEPWEYELRIPRDPRALGIARNTLRGILTTHGLSGLIARAELLMCELATNSVRYSDNASSVRLCWMHPMLRVSVWDTNPKLPVTTMGLDLETEGGRGLLILDVLADSWGGFAIEDEPFGVPGKTIWFELAWDGPAPEPSVAA